MSAREDQQLFCRIGLLAERWPLLEVSGEVDVASSDGLRDELSNLIDLVSSDIVLDLSNVSFIDCSGLTALMAGLRQLEDKSGATLRLVGATPQARRLLAITGLDRVFPMHDTTAELVACDACSQSRTAHIALTAADPSTADWHSAGPAHKYWL